MMKIRNALLISISYLSLSPVAWAVSSPVESEFIFTQTSNTHHAFQPQLLSSQNFTQPISTHRDLSAPISLALTDAGKLPQLASVCFITDAGNCSDDSFTPDGGSSGGKPNTPSGGCEDNDAWCLDNQKRCANEGYSLSSCPDGQKPTNFCIYDNRFFEKCVCRDDLVSCTKPQYGAGASCNGKYERCETDNPRACKEDGYTKTGACPVLSHANKTCPYDGSYYDQCVCNSGLQSCVSPLQGVGESCNGQYQSCCNTCPEYTYTSIPNGYVSAGECDSCDGKKYKITTNPCSGYPTYCECGYDTSSAQCQSGSSIRYKSCKKCCEPTCTTESNCKNGSTQVSNGCGGYCTVCNKTGNYHCPDGSSVPDASMCRSDPDGIIVQDGSYCIIISKYQGYGPGDVAMKSTPSGWKFPSLSVMQKASQHVGIINQQLNRIGEPNLLNTWYWTNTYWNENYVYAINPYTGVYTKTGASGGTTVSRAYHRYYKDC